jgi:hypothetical protein
LKEIETTTGKKISKTLEVVRLDHHFLNSTSVAQGIKTRAEKWNCIKLKSSAHQKKQLQESGNNPKTEIIHSTIYKYIKKVKTSRTNSKINEWSNELDSSQKNTHG